jgi:probable F420-dependent oxidoreductase
VRVGIVTPVVTLLPDAHARWEETAGFDEVAAVARAADRLGYHHLTCSEHVAIPTRVASVRGGRYWDPLATFGALAVQTKQIRLATHVLVLGYHHPLAIAKRYGTLDRISDGRLILGAGVGSLREEFDLLGAPFDDRGARADDALRALRAAFGQERPAYAGPHYAFDDVVVDPCGVQRGVRIWIGGRTARSLRRAVELADGWVPFGLSRTQLADLLARARDTPAWEDRTTPLEIVLEPRPPVDPSGDPETTSERIDAIVAAGATALNLRFVHHSPGHYVEQLEAAAGLLRLLDAEA